MSEFMALGITIVDSFLTHHGCTMQQETVNEFIHKLADEILECDLTTRHQRTSTAWNGFDLPKPKRPTNVIHLTPQKKLRPHPTTPTGQRTKVTHVHRCGVGFVASTRVHRHAPDVTMRWLCVTPNIEGIALTHIVPPTMKVNSIQTCVFSSDTTNGTLQFGQL